MARLLIEEHLNEGSSTAVPDNAAVAESSSKAGKRKRLGDLEDPKPGKKLRTLPKAAGGQIMPPPGLDAAVDDDVQCGYYAEERFRASWQITHVSGIYLKGEFDGRSGTRQCSYLFERFLLECALVRPARVYLPSISWSSCHSLSSS